MTMTLAELGNLSLTGKHRRAFLETIVVIYNVDRILFLGLAQLCRRQFGHPAPHFPEALERLAWLIIIAYR